ncbi:MAG: radical SAM protein [Chloroflexi bacterium]|nr:radical SAM protein [Chloroflexota bacterium]
MTAAEHRSEPAIRTNERPRDPWADGSDGGGLDGRSLDHWVVSTRGPRNTVRSDRAYAAFVEEEMSAAGELTPVAALFLTNRECPFRCLMCDLWKNTLQYAVSAGTIPGQIERALAELPPARQIKLYNSGSFFDPNAIPRSDYPAIARLLEPFEHTIVECHPAFVGPRVLEFQQRLSSTLEVAIGLETAHPGVLAKLNKRMTKDSFARAVEVLAAQGVAVRVFILLRPPFLNEAEGLEWAIRSIDFAFDCGASVCTVIPTRRGSGQRPVPAARCDACESFGMRP